MRRNFAVPEGMKWCPVCKTTLPLESFWRNRSRYDGRGHYCKGCRKPKPRPAVVISIDRADLAWLAGICEGEASFTLSYVRETKWGRLGYPTIQLGMSDRDVVERAWRISTVGEFRGPYAPPTKRPGHKPRWLWSVARAPEAVAMMTLLLPLMGERRQSQIRHVLANTSLRKTIADPILTILP